MNQILGFGFRRLGKTLVGQVIAFAVLLLIYTVIEHEASPRYRQPSITPPPITYQVGENR